MKKLFFLPLICAVMFLAGCKKEEPPRRWDYPNVSIIINVEDENGVNLLNERTAGTDCIINNKMKITYNGEEFPLKKPTRADEPILPVMNGFRLMGWYAEAKLSFGEFSIDTKEYRGETFTIDWGDGTQSQVTFDLYATPNGNDQPTFHYATRLDGVTNNETSLTVDVKAVDPDAIGK
jgi:hypothetical protein